MMEADPLPTGQKSQHSENAEQHDNGIEACALPITPAQMQPHAEFIKGQRHANSVSKCAHAPLLFVQPGKKQNSGDRGEQKNPVVQMMHVSTAQVEKQVRHAPSHDQNHQCSRRDEREKKRDER